MPPTLYAPRPRNTIQYRLPVLAPPVSWTGGPANAKLAARGVSPGVQRVWRPFHKELTTRASIAHHRSRNMLRKLVSKSRPRIVGIGMARHLAYKSSETQNLDLQAGSTVWHPLRLICLVCSPLQLADHRSDFVLTSLPRRLFVATHQPSNIAGLPAVMLLCLD